MKKLLCLVALTGFAFCHADHYVVIAEGSSDDDDYSNDCDCEEHIVYEEPSECDRCNWINYYWDDYVEDTMERDNAWPGKREDSFYDYIVR